MNPLQTISPPKAPGVTTNESPVAYSDRRGQEALAGHLDDHRKAHGQYFTPPEVAVFLAELAATEAPTVRILDPGAGSGILACAVAERLAAGGGCRRLVLDAYECDSLLVPVLTESLEYLAAWLAERGIVFEFRVIPEDFILATSGSLDRPGSYTVAVSNPPYYKTGKSHAVASIPALYGSSNIYAAFMLAASRLLVDGGRFVFITPRSYASGAYFREFRRRLFAEILPERFHLFGSRKLAFARDELLQEWLVLAGVKAAGWQERTRSGGSVLVSQSAGTARLELTEVREVPLDLALDHTHPEQFLRLPSDELEERVLRTVDAWPCSLHSLGLEVSTGRVVPFRAMSFQHTKPPANAWVPLLWLQHIEAMRVSWPINFRKPEYFDDLPESRPLLVPDDNYVLLRRFSSKEQHRRLTAAPLYRGQLRSERIGIENHLNYIWAKSGELSPKMARGIALLLNSRLLDTYFRVLNGNTEVSATEMRSLPIPDRATIEALGSRFTDDADLQLVDEWLENNLAQKG